MSDLCARLQNVAEAGVYHLGCPVEVLRANALLAELCMLEVELQGLHGKGEFLAALARAIQAPDWFGHNFDALADALADLSWLETACRGYVLLLLHGGETLQLEPADCRAVCGIFDEVVEYWRGQGVPFWVFLA